MSKSVKEVFLSRGLDFPKFDTVDSESADYEERHYEAAKWVSTVVTANEENEAAKKGFWKLFNYIQGKNEKGTKIEMTIPVLKLVTHGSTSYTVSFFVPFLHQSSPLAPSEEEVIIEEKGEMTVFVRCFGGFVRGDKNSGEARLLAESLKRDGKSFQEDFYYTAGYDSPFKLLNRHNEVWYLKKNGGVI
ncbi:UNVERIFIED_CONTAM: hypothetical protein FKN15_026732 [Acipenser sinensis]